MRNAKGSNSRSRIWMASTTLIDLSSFVHFHLHHSFSLVVEFRANVPACVFIILVLMEEMCVDMNLVVNPSTA